jgi:hypothetical protein
VCRLAVASLQQLSFFFSCAVITQKHKFLESSTKNLQFVGGRRKKKNLAERSNNENPVVVVMRDLNHAMVGTFAVICATKFNAG